MRLLELLFLLQQTDAYTLSGTSLTFTGTVPSGTNNVQVVHLGLTVQVPAPADGTVTNAKLADMAANTVKVRDANSSGVPSDKAVATTEILIGDGTGFTAAALSSDVTMTNAGAVTIANDAVTYAKMQDTSVNNRLLGAATAGTIAEVQVATDMVADNAVTLAKLEDGTQGDILYYGASGAPARLGFGTSGDFLKTQGTGANPVWAAAATADCVLISTTTMSGTASSVDITAGIDSTYSIYRLWYLNVSAEGAGNTLYMKVSDDGGTTFKGTGYLHTGWGANYTGGATSSQIQAAAGFVQMGNNIANYDDDTTEGSCGYVEFYTPNISRKPVFTGLSAQFSDDGSAWAYYWGGHYGTAITIDAIQIAASNNLHGTLKLYGYK